jgi:hypothetical protein
MNDFFGRHRHPSLVLQPQEASSKRDLSPHNCVDRVFWLCGMKFVDPTGMREHSDH